MLYVGIDVASTKHDCCIIDSNGADLISNFTFENNREGFNQLIKTIRSFSKEKNFKDVRVALESTGHYSNNLNSFLMCNSLNTVVFNPLRVNLYRKAQTLRKTKTDKTDAKFLAVMLFSSDAKLYTSASYQISELKVLVRHRSRLIAQRSKLKVSLRRLVTITFPELPSVVYSINQASILALLLEFPTAKVISESHLTRLSNLLAESSRGKYGKDKATLIKELAINSIGSSSISTGFELQQTIRLIKNLQNELNILDEHIKTAMIEINSPILTIPGISFTLGAIILAEIGDISNFDNPSKLLAYAGLDPSTYQSGNFTAGHTPMVKRGSTYLRYAILTAARTVAMRDIGFKNYALKKKLEGKHHYVVMSHVGKKLIRVIFHLLKTNSTFVSHA